MGFQYTQAQGFRLGSWEGRTYSSDAPAPRSMLRLFLAFAIYTAAPVAAVPFIGLSWSAPLFYAVALEMLGLLRGWGIQREGRWLALASLLWAGMLFSFAVSTLTSDTVVPDLASVARLYQFAYWMLVFVLSVHLIRRGNVGPRLPAYLATAVVALAAIVLLERVVLGTMRPNGYSSLTRMTQNAYGWQFSTFSPFLLPLALAGRRRTHRLALMGLLIVWAAAAVNLSRSSWIAIAAGLVAFLLLHAAATRSVGGLLKAGLAAAVAVSLACAAPAEVKQPVLDRYQKLQAYQSDKSYLIRVLMIQKAWRLFVEHPVFGVGPAQFRRVSTPLDPPPELRYAPQSHLDALSAHNSYMLLLAEGGLACTLPFVAILLTLLFRGAAAAVTLFRRGEPWALGAYASLVGMSIHLWSLAGLTNTAPWLVYAMVAAAIGRARDLSMVPGTAPRAVGRGASWEVRSR